MESPESEKQAWDEFNRNKFKALTSNEKVNRCPELQSLLYDLDLLPEQLDMASHDYQRMLIIINWFAENAPFESVVGWRDTRGALDLTNHLKTWDRWRVLDIDFTFLRARGLAAKTLSDTTVAKDLLRICGRCGCKSHRSSSALRGVTVAAVKNPRVTAEKQSLFGRGSQPGILGNTRSLGEEPAAPANFLRKRCSVNVQSPQPHKRSAPALRRGLQMTTEAAGSCPLKKPVSYVTHDGCFAGMLFKPSSVVMTGFKA